MQQTNIIDILFKQRIHKTNTILKPTYGEIFHLTSKPRSGNRMYIHWLFVFIKHTEF